MAKPAVILVGADKGGVGKTTVSRALLDYFIAHNIPTRAFDTESPKGTLKRFHPDVDRGGGHALHRRPDEDLRHAVERGRQVTVIDIRAGLLSTTLRALRDIGFLDAAKKAQLTFTVFHILGPSIASLSEIDETAGFMDDAHYILVKNFINNTTFFEWDPATYNSYFNKIKDAHDITIPKLNEMACEQVEIASVPYVSFVANKAGDGQSANYSFVLRGYVRHWLGNVWAEFDRVKLIDMVAPELQRKGAARQA